MKQNGGFRVRDELARFDAEMKGLFVEEKLEEMSEELAEQSDEDVKELSNYNWNIIRKYYDSENLELLFKHFRFVAYTCFIVEYAHRRGVISDEAFQIMMSIYNDIYELKRKQRGANN